MANRTQKTGFLSPEVVGIPKYPPINRSQEMIDNAPPEAPEDPTKVSDPTPEELMEGIPDADAE
jgi:hypothetical protein